MIQHYNDILAEILIDEENLQARIKELGGKVARTQRLVNSKLARYDDPVVSVGTSEMYEARCRVRHEVSR